MKWESVVNRVAKCELGEKMLVCGRATGWWDKQIKNRIYKTRSIIIYRLLIVGKICGMSTVDY